MAKPGLMQGAGHDTDDDGALVDPPAPPITMPPMAAAAFSEATAG